MNAIVDPAAAPRLYAGSGPPQPAPAAYTLLVPTDAAWPRETLLRATVADALQRNGKVVDEDTLDATIAGASGAGGPLAGLAPQWKLHAGGGRDDGRASPPFLGYAIELPATTQQALLASATGIASAQRTAGPAPVDASLSELRALAGSHGAGDVLRTLGAIEAAIQAGQAAGAQGQRVDAVAVRSLVEFATRMGKEREAAKLLERYTAVRGLEDGVRAIGTDAARVFNGRDPRTREALTTDARIESAFGLLDNGFKFAGQLGATAQLFGIGGRFASTLIGIAPAGVAIVGFAAGIYGLVKHVRAAINAPQWDEFRARFPEAEGVEPKQFLKAALRQVAGMPVDGDNGLSTSTRILDLLGQHPETRERYLAFLKTKVEPDALVDALAAGRFDGITAAQAAELARASKGYAREFLEHEIDDSKRYARDRDGDRTRGTYLLEGAQREQAERNTRKLGGTLDEALRVGGILTGSAEQVVGSFQQLLATLKGGAQLDGKPLDAQQQRNLSAATAAAAAGAGLSRVDHLLPSRDGRTLFAIQGDPQSETRRTVAIDIATGAAQGVEASNRLREAAPPVLSVSAPDSMQAQRTQ